MISKEFVIKRLAAGAANPSCKKCYGRGMMGRRLRAGGGVTVLICRCAIKGFKPKADGHIHFKREEEQINEGR